MFRKDEDEEKKDAEEGEEKEAEEVEEAPKRLKKPQPKNMSTKKRPMTRRIKEFLYLHLLQKPEEMEESETKADEGEEKEEEAIGTKSLRSRTRRSNVAETPKAEEQTPKRRGKAAKSTKKDVAAEAEDESEQDAAKEKDKAEDKDEQPSR
ncbi:unnamed protein product, partial [Cylicostephanus goldi]